MLEVRGVHKSWKAASALIDVGFHVAHAAYVVLLGESGSGKSTLLRAIAGLIEIDAGSITLNGIGLTPLPPHQRPVSTVFQDYALFPHMTVARNIAFGLEQQGCAAPEIRQRVGRMLEIVGLPGMEQRMPQSLSGGQQQRVALARALAVAPQLVLLDEPLGALDTDFRHAMRRELHRIQRDSGVTFLHVSHDREEALSLADHLLVMEAGRLIGDGTPAALREQPWNVRVATVVGLSNTVPDPDQPETIIAFAPEHVVVGRGRWQGQIAAIHTLGAITECEIVMPDGRLVRLRSAQHTPGTVTIGDDVWWDVVPGQSRRIPAR